MAAEVLDETFKKLSYCSPPSSPILSHAQFGSNIKRIDFFALIKYCKCSPKKSPKTTPTTLAFPSTSTSLILNFFFMKDGFTEDSVIQEGG